MNERACGEWPAPVRPHEVDLSPRLVDLRDLVEHAVDAAAPRFAARRQTLALLVGSAPIWIRVDPLRITQVISSLLDNAASFTPRGGRIVVCVECRRDDVVLRVRGGGTGISGDARERIFESLQRGSTVGGDDLGGARHLGVGLALVCGLVRLHGGEVSAKSRGLGVGAELVVRLPLSLPAVCSLPHPAREGDPQRSGRARGFGCALAI